MEQCSEQHKVRLWCGLQQAKLGQGPELRRDTFSERVRKGQRGAAPSFLCSPCRYPVQGLQGSRFLLAILMTASARRTDLLRGEKHGRKSKGIYAVTDQPNTELDLRGVICPYNFVKTKLKLEAMEQGQVLSVLLDDGDPIRNVPRSVSNEGHTVVSQDRIEGFYRVLIRRRQDE